MAALVTVYSTPATYVATQLNSYTDMAYVMDQIRALGYTGNMQTDVAGNYQLWFQSTSQNSSWSAKLGDWVVVKNNSIASSVPAAQAASLYTTTPPA